MSKDEEKRKKYLEEYYKRPEVIARQKEASRKYSKSPKGVKRAEEYRKSLKGIKTRKKYANSLKAIETRKKYYKTSKGEQARRRGALSWKYKIKEEKYFEILEKQKGVCAICGSDSPKRKGSKYFTVDHNHTTMQLRGLLCHPCNVMLGMAKDNIEVLEKAIEYLKYWEK